MEQQPREVDAGGRRLDACGMSASKLASNTATTETTTPIAVMPMTSGNLITRWLTYPNTATKVTTSPMICNALMRSLSLQSRVASESQGEELGCPSHSRTGTHVLPPG